MAADKETLINLRNLTPQEQVENDCKALELFYDSPGNNARKVKPFLAKLFITVRYGGLQFRENQKTSIGISGWQWWSYTGLPVGAVFGHGGRLMIQDDTQNSEFTEWLFSDISWLMTSRWSTHKVKRLNVQEAVAGNLQKWIKEVKSKAHRCAGLNAACYGDGRLNPHSNERVKRLYGHHGHFCVVRDRLADRTGVLIGLEGSRPADMKRLYITADDQYGGSHGAGGMSGEFSPTGSRKWRFLTMGPGCRYGEDDTDTGFRDKFYNIMNPRVKYHKVPKILTLGIPVHAGLKYDDPKVADTLLIIMDNTRSAGIKKKYADLGDDDEFIKNIVRTTTYPEDAPAIGRPHTNEHQNVRQRYKRLMGANYLENIKQVYKCNIKLDKRPLGKAVLPGKGKSKGKPVIGVRPNDISPLLELKEDEKKLGEDEVIVPDDIGGPIPKFHPLGWRDPELAQANQQGYPNPKEHNWRRYGKPKGLNVGNTTRALVEMIKDKFDIQAIRRMAWCLEAYNNKSMLDQADYRDNHLIPLMEAFREGHTYKDFAAGVLGPPFSTKQTKLIKQLHTEEWMEIHRQISGY
jgi:hypothetical protein